MRKVKLSDYPTAKKIKSFPNYAVTLCGTVLNISKLDKDGNVYALTPSKGCGGHYRVDLRYNGKSTTSYVKNLVGEAFLTKPACNKNYILYHLDENKANNSALNLAYIQFSELCLLTNSIEYREKLKHKSNGRAL